MRGSRSQRAEVDSINLALSFAQKDLQCIQRLIAAAAGVVFRDLFEFTCDTDSIVSSPTAVSSVPPARTVGRRHRLNASVMDPSNGISLRHVAATRRSYSR